MRRKVNPFEKKKRKVSFFEKTELKISNKKEKVLYFWRLYIGGFGEPRTIVTKSSRSSIYKNVQKPPKIRSMKTRKSNELQPDQWAILGDSLMGKLRGTRENQRSRNFFDSLSARPPLLLRISSSRLWSSDFGLIPPLVKKKQTVRGTVICYLLPVAEFYWKTNKFVGWWRKT